jgi:hypothetical protein
MLNKTLLFRLEIVLLCPVLGFSTGKLTFSTVAHVDFFVIKLSDGSGVIRRHSTGQSTPVSNDRAGPSDIQSFSDSLKSRLNAVSTKYVNLS